MQARYTRIFTDDRGQSRFEDLSVELSLGLAVPPSQPLHNAPFLAAGGTFCVGAPTDWQGNAPHPAPRRMVFITVEGEYEVTASEGVTRRFPAGSVLLLEDTTGAGHSTRISSSDKVVVFAVQLAEP